MRFPCELIPQNEQSEGDALESGVTKKPMHPFGNKDKSPYVEIRDENTGDAYFEGYRYGEKT